jgi:predicted RNA-binding Zn-ribbon protein involved in translation (DUF1610 family)
MTLKKSKSINLSGMMCGIAVIVLGGITGLILLVSDVGGSSTALTLFYILGIPGIACMIGVTLILRAIPFSGGSLFSRTSGQQMDIEISGEKSFIHQPPEACSSCGAGISTETVEWVGPLRIKCPYCGATLNTVRREV